MGIKRWWAIVGRAGWREGAMLKVAKKFPHLANSLYNTLAQVFRSKTAGASVTPKTRLPAVQVTYSGRWFFARFSKVHLNHELPFVVGHVTAFVIIRDIKCFSEWDMSLTDLSLWIMAFWFSSRVITARCLHQWWKFMGLFRLKRKRPWFCG